MAADKASWHNGLENKELQEDCGYQRLSWPPNSPDLNPIENAWSLLKKELKKPFSRLKRRPYSAAELFHAAKAEWELIPQESTVKTQIEEKCARTLALPLLVRRDLYSFCFVSTGG